MQLEQLEYWPLWPYRHSFLIAPELVFYWNWGGDRNTSASLQLVAGSDSAGKEPLSFLHCSLPECPGAPWLVLVKTRACRVPFTGPTPFSRLLFTDPVEDGSAAEAGP